MRVNDMARTICGSRRANSRPVADLLEQSGLPSVNCLAIRSTAIGAWKALRPLCGADLNPVTSLFGLPVSSSTRAGDLGVWRPATKFPMKTFIDVATTIWNSNHDLRLAPLIGTAKRVASLMAEVCPL